MFKKHFIIGFLFAGNVLITDAQNLVPNPSFEDTVLCPNGLGEIYYCKSWFNPTDNSPDYFNQCSNNVSVPNNFPIGFQNARTGNAYTGFACIYNTPNGREYIEVKLLDSLTLGKQYLIEFFVTLAEISDSAVDRIGIYISKDSVFNHNAFLLNLPYQPQIENPQGNFLTDTLTWTKISGMYYAQGGEKFITIGNFYPDSLTGVVAVPAPWSAIAYYYIDDVSVIDSGFAGINEAQENIAINIFPNPFSIKTTLQTDNIFHNATLTVDNCFGQTVAQIKNINGQTITFNRDNLPSGLYFVRLTERNKIIAVDKLVITDK